MPMMIEAHLKIQEKFKILEPDVVPCFGGSKSRLFDQLVSEQDGKSSSFNNFEGGSESKKSDIDDLIDRMDQINIGTSLIKNYKESRISNTL